MVSQTQGKPTDEQIKWFWEQCGFKYTGGDWCYAPDRMHYLRRPPSIDLNSLFKYAVPKLRSLGYGINMVIFSKLDLVSVTLGKGKYKGQTVIHFQCEDKDPALALFLAIYKAFGGK